MNSKPWALKKLQQAYEALKRNRLARRNYPENYPYTLEELLDGFRCGGTPDRDSYAKIFLYFMEGYEFYRSKKGALVAYPGYASNHGDRVDQLEGFSRLAPLLGAWLYGGRTDEIVLHSGKRLVLSQLLREALLAGTNRKSEEYWGDIQKRDQRIVEAADIALTLWLTRQQVWEHMKFPERRAIAKWLASVNTRQIPDNNWHLFIVLINVVLLELGSEKGSLEKVHTHYQAMKRFYRGSGWYTDGVHHGERLDYYNAWGIHYALYWIDQIYPSLDTEHIRETLATFAFDLKHFFTPKGFPMYGRSICYRMALPAPLVMAAAHRSAGITFGEARRAMDVTWSYFIQHGALRAGTITQGYWDEDPRLLDAYSGQGSALWSLRSLVAAFSQPDNSDYWKAEPEPLPIEKDDYVFELETPGWRIRGQKSSGVVELQRLKSSAPKNAPVVAGYGPMEKIMEKITGRVYRPKNIMAKYHRHSYHSEPPFFLE